LCKFHIQHQRNSLHSFLCSSLCFPLVKRLTAVHSHNKTPSTLFFSSQFLFLSAPISLHFTTQIIINHNFSFSIFLPLVPSLFPSTFFFVVKEIWMLIDTPILL
jgi:hypothetical protein